MALSVLEKRLEDAYNELPARLNRLLEADKSRGGRIARDPQAVRRLETRLRNRITQDVLDFDLPRAEARDKALTGSPSAPVGTSAPLIGEVKDRLSKPDDLSVDFDAPPERRFSMVARDAAEGFDVLDEVRQMRKERAEVPDFYGKTDAESRRQLFEFTRLGLGKDKNFNLPREFAEKSGVSADQFNKTMRRELFDQVKQRAQERNLTPEQFEGFRRSAEGLGVTGQMFDSTFQREGITAAVGSGETTPDPADFDRAIGQGDTPAATSPAPAVGGATAVASASALPAAERQARAAMGVREATSGLEAMDRRESDDYVLGSGSALRAGKAFQTGTALKQAPEELGTRAGDLDREARKAAADGDKKTAQELRAAAAVERLNTPNIGTGAQSDRQELLRREGSRLRKQASNIIEAGSPRSNIKQSARNRNRETTS